MSALAILMNVAAYAACAAWALAWALIFVRYPWLPIAMMPFVYIFIRHWLRGLR